MTAHIDWHVTDRDRVCRICEEKIDRGEEALVMIGVNVKGKQNLHFHTECLNYQMELVMTGVTIRDDRGE